MAAPSIGRLDHTCRTQKYPHKTNPAKKFAGSVGKYLPTNVTESVTNVFTPAKSPSSVDSVIDRSIVATFSENTRDSTRVTSRTLVTFVVSGWFG